MRLASNPVIIDNHNIIFSSRGKLYLLKQQTGTYQEYHIYGKGTARSLQLIGNKLLWISPKEGVFCFDVKNKKPVWKNSLAQSHSTSIKICNINTHPQKEVLISGETTYCLNFKNGKILWTFRPKQITHEVSFTHRDKYDNRKIITHSGRTIYIINSNGKLENTYQTTKDIKKHIVVDYDNDGISEILFLAGNKVTCIRSVLSKQIKKYKKDIYLAYPPLVIDANDDGFKDYIIGNRRGELYALNGKNMQLLWRKNLSSKIFPFTLIDQNRFIFICNLKVFCFKKDGTHLWSYDLREIQPKKAIIVKNKLVVADINKDGEPEILGGLIEKGIFCISGKSGKLFWSIDIQRVYRQPFIIDIDRDGFYEIIVSEGTTTGTSSPIHCYNHNGQRRWSSKIKHICIMKDSIAIKDIDKNGTYELILGQGVGNFACLDAKTGRTLWKNQVLSGTINSNILVQDSNDNQREEIIASSNNGNIICLDALTGKKLWRKKYGKK